jgi:hypothetical protein
VLAVDYGVSCESRAYYAASVYMALALAIYVAGVPCALVARLWANRQGEASSPTELARLDGPLATLTAKYSAQFYWVEFVEIYERLMMCGLGVFIFPHKPSMRVALILIYRSFKLWLWKYGPIVDRAHRDVSTLCHGYLSFVVILAVMELSATPPTELQRFVFSCFLFGSFVTVIALARFVASRAGQDKGDSTSLQRECSARARFGNSTHASRALREMIARPKISRNEWKTAEI